MTKAGLNKTGDSQLSGLTVVIRWYRNNPSDPTVSVTSIWAMLQRIVGATETTLLPESTNSILPRYSPTRFGVNEAIQVPARIALKAWPNRIDCIGLRA